MRRAISWVYWEPKSRMRIIVCPPTRDACFVVASVSHRHVLQEYAPVRNLAPPRIRPLLDGQRLLCCTQSGLSNPVVGRFFGDKHIMHVALSLARGSDANEARFGAQLIDRARPKVAHPCAQAAYELVNVVRQRSSVRNLPFDPFRNQLRLFDVPLTIAVAAAVPHRAQRPHPAVNLVGPSLIKDSFARALLGPREQTSDHDRMSPG